MATYVLMDDGHLTEIAEHIAELLEDGNFQTIQEKISPLHPADVAYIIDNLSSLQRRTLFQYLVEKIAPETLTQISPSILKEIIPHLDLSQVRAIITNLESDEGSAFLELFPSEYRQKIFKSLSPIDQQSITLNMSWPTRSAGRIMQTNFISVSPNWTVGQTLNYLRTIPDNLPSTFHHIFLLNNEKFSGAVDLSRLVTTRHHKKLSELSEDNTPLIPAILPQEQIANIFRRQNLISAPVVDEKHHMLGVINIDDVVDVIDEEFEEDIQALTGSTDSHVFDGPFSASRKRTKWLLLNLLTAFLSVSVLTFFTKTLTQTITLVALLPLIGSLGGNSGIQSMAITIRTLGVGALRSKSGFYLLFRETMAAFINGTLVAIVAAVLAYFFFGNISLSLILGGAMVIAMTLAAIIGVAIPLLLHILRTDPAVGSGVLLTTSVDMLSFFIFLGLASLFLL